MTNTNDSPGLAFEKWARAEAESHHEDHLAFRSKGTPAYGPEDCDNCKGASSTYAQYRAPFLAGRASASSPEQEAAIKLMVEALEGAFAEHYGEPDGLHNCDRNPYSGPSSDEEIARGEYSAHLLKPCTCGADEQNTIIRSALQAATLAGLTEKE